MSHWAELDENNVVLRVVVGDNNDPAGDEGYQWLIDNLGGTWVKTSYNSFAGKRKNPETNELTNEEGFRKNYASVGFTYDEIRDAFIPPQPFPSWTFNEETCLWDSPIPYDFDDEHEWSEEQQTWVLKTL